MMWIQLELALCFSLHCADVSAVEPSSSELIEQLGHRNYRTLANAEKMIMSKGGMDFVPTLLGAVEDSDLERSRRAFAILKAILLGNLNKDSNGWRLIEHLSKSKIDRIRNWSLWQLDMRLHAVARIQLIERFLQYTSWEKG